MALTTPTFQRNNKLLFTFPSNFPNSFRFNKSLPSLSFSSQPLLSSLSSPSQSSSCCRITRVSIASVEHAPPAPEFEYRKEISRLQSLRLGLSNLKKLEDKIKLLNTDSRVKQFFDRHEDEFSRIVDCLNFDKYNLYLLKCLVASGQGHVISSGLELFVKNKVTGSLKSAFYALAEMIERWDDVKGVGESFEKNNVVVQKEEIEGLRKLLKTLGEVEEFYDCIGGIIGYQITVLELLTGTSPEKHTENWSPHLNEAMQCEFLEIHSPGGTDLLQNTEYASQAALWGIEGLPDLGEIYPLGGSADRLGLVDPDTGECLPAAMLPYFGRTLLEGLIRDLQAREFLYFKVYGKQCITPVAIMTSSAKNNHADITSLCEQLQWFGRGQSNFRLFEQPLVPAVSAEDGQWMVTKPFTPVCKPGGHGVIWKLAHDKGVFQWFYDRGRKGATVRQVSNVVAATDLTLLALAGIGLRHGKKLGFASCKRSAGATEGINVLLEKRNLDGKWAYGLSCIEYTEFEKFGIMDASTSHSSLQAQYPANTNILYVDLPSAELVGSKDNVNSLPGMVLNVKKPIVYVDQFGIRRSVLGGRLECTMQNIADNFSNKYSSRCYKSMEDELDTFLVYNERRKVTSSAKRKLRHSDKSLHQTPEGSLLDIMRNAYDLLSQCDIKIPEIESNDKYTDSGPPYLILLHPALGPLWEVIRQKFRGGSISKGSELQVEVVEFFWRDVQLDGSMIIEAEHVLGSTRIDELGEPILQFGNRCGKCKLQNIKVQNKGIDWSSSENVYWKHDVRRDEAFKVILHGNAEFEATDVTLKGNHVFEVPNGHKLKITPGNSGIALQLDPIESKMMDTGSWFWRYKIKGKHIQLELVDL